MNVESEGGCSTIYPPVGGVFDAQQERSSKRQMRKLDCYNWIVIKRPKAPGRAHELRSQLMPRDKKEAEGSHVPSF